MQVLVGDLFRRSAGRMVARLARVFGSEHLDLAEDVVHDALLRALETWPYRGIPEIPEAWLFEVAKNRARDVLRRAARLHRLAPLLDLDLAQELDRGTVLDDELAMLFMCCHPEPAESERTPLTLKTVGGFGIGEIAQALLTSRRAVQQRIVRAKRRMRERELRPVLPPEPDMVRRLEAVLEVVYLMFNEGYAAHEGDVRVRRELCEEAVRLCGLLLEREATARGEVHALMALMLFQTSRLAARTDAAGVPLSLDEQDRTQWDGASIARALRHLDRARAAERLTEYHLEAGLAACHATAPSWEATDWIEILRLYDALLEINPSPVVALNRTVALAAGAAPLCPHGRHAG